MSTRCILWQVELHPEVDTDHLPITLLADQKPGTLVVSLGVTLKKQCGMSAIFFSCFIEVAKIPTWSPTSRADSIPIFEDLEIHLPTTTWLITIVKTPIYRCVFMNGELVNQGYSPITTRGVLHHPSPSIQLYANRWGGAKYAQSLLPFWAFLTTTWWLSMLSCPETIVPLHKQLEIGVLTLTGYPP